MDLFQAELVEAQQKEINRLKKINEELTSDCGHLNKIYKGTIGILCEITAEGEVTLNTESKRFKDLWEITGEYDEYVNKVDKYQSLNMGDVARSIHYPECWDTSTYPALSDAIENMTCDADHCAKCAKD